MYFFDLYLKEPKLHRKEYQNRDELYHAITVLQGNHDGFWFRKYHSKRLIELWENWEEGVVRKVQDLN